MIGPRLLRVGVLIAGVFLPACGDSSGPETTSGDFALLTANGSAPPVLVGATVSCDQFLVSGQVTLTPTRTFDLVGSVSIDCTRAGGAVQSQPFGLSGVYALNGQGITFTIPGQASLSGSIHGDTLSATIPASQFTFPNPVALVLTRVTQ